MKLSLTEPETAELSWLHDLCSPSRPGRWFSRQGYWIDVTTKNFEFAQSQLTKGADDVIFLATRRQPVREPGYYLLTPLKG